MVGGIVIEVIEQCAIYVRAGHPIKEGDKLWWQGGYAFWTPVPIQKGRIEIRIEKTSGSGVNRPIGHEIAPIRSLVVS